MVEVIQGLCKGC